MANINNSGSGIFVYGTPFDDEIFAYNQSDVATTVVGGAGNDIYYIDAYLEKLKNTAILLKTLLLKRLMAATIPLT